MKKFVTITLVVVAVAALVMIVYFSGHDNDPVEPYSKDTKQKASAPDTAPAQGTPATGSGQVNPPHSQVALNGSAVTIDAQPLADGQARFFTVQLPAAKAVNFFVVKDSLGVLRAAADACEVCYQQKKGFHQEGAEIVCNNCGNRYPLEKIATEKGGCNPGPISPALQAAGGTITISQAELEQVAQLF